MDITITAPRLKGTGDSSGDFSEWKKIIKNKTHPYIYFRLGWLPAQDKTCRNCYVIHKGAIRGFFCIKGFMSVVKESDDLLQGRYVMLITDSWREIEPIKARGHRNFRYLQDTELILEGSKSLLTEMYEELERRCQGKQH